MLKKRLVGCLTVKGGIVVQSIGFKKYLPVGNVNIAVEFLSRWGIDEIILLDIEATAQARRPDFAMIKEASKRNFVPLTVGGGIKTTDDIVQLIHHGADKISINKIALVNPKFIQKAANVFGTQCIIVSMDVKKNSKQEYEVFSDSGETPTGLDPVKWAQDAEQLGAGEIFLNSIDRDGAQLGYDINLTREVSGAVSIPVIACGGVGHPEHFYQGIVEGNASAVCAGNYFHFTEHSPITAKFYLLQRLPEDIRLDSYANYKGVPFMKTGRIAKMGEEYLEKLMFEFLPEEVI